MMRCRAVIAAAAVLAALAACEDEPTPDIPDPTPSSASPSPSESSPTSSPTPEVLTPEETVEAWFEAWTMALQTGDTSSVTALSSTACASCNRLIAKVDDLYGKGGSLETSGWTPLIRDDAPNSTGNSPVFLLRVEQGRQVLLDERGDVVDETPRMEVPMRMTLGMISGGWQVTRLEILS